MVKAGGTPDPDDLRENMRGSRLGVPFPSNDDGDEGGEDQGDEPADDGGDEDQGDGEDQGATPEPRRSGRSWAPSAAVSTGAGWVLGLLLWGWVGLPLIQGGPSQVGKVLKAKFTNRAPDGSELP